ncbi:MAG: type III-A CRISPR-associated protein Csm2 [Pseudomonadota bacterium]
MGDWKKDLSKHPSNSGSEALVKKCACGKDITKPGSNICGVCHRKKINQGPLHRSTPAGVRLRDGYLTEGYFDERGNLFDRYIAREGDADFIAEQLGHSYPAMTNHQLRRFYSHVRAAANRLKMTCNFPAVYVDLKKLEPFVAEAKGKGKIPDLFYNFIIKNLSAVKTEQDFSNGFLEHFQAVVAYFTFHHPKK